MTCKFIAICPSATGWCLNGMKDAESCIEHLIAAAHGPDSQPAKVVLYKCDRRRCEKCNDYCEHTKDIKHAASFELFSGVFVEK